MLHPDFIKELAGRVAREVGEKVQFYDSNGLRDNDGVVQEQLRPHIEAALQHALSERAVTRGEHLTPHKPRRITRQAVAAAVKGMFIGGDGGDRNQEAAMLLLVDHEYRNGQRGAWGRAALTNYLCRKLGVDK